MPAELDAKSANITVYQIIHGKLSVNKFIFN